MRVVEHTQAQQLVVESYAKLATIAIEFSPDGKSIIWLYVS